MKMSKIHKGNILQTGQYFIGFRMIGNLKMKDQTAQGIKKVMVIKS